ncbi:MAG: hypothetical protein D4S01_02580 [Dehalococcoidia bacterium]|nr:MAG: hypothetical protein D4S01_02580 [Dehalococcoidia bacterium]
MSIEEHLERLNKLQMAIDKTLDEPRSSYAYSYVRPRLIKELGQAVSEAKMAGMTEDDIHELVTELEVLTGRRPINLEYFWDPRRLLKGWRKE